jgi:Immunoglobulin I-set domain/Immunoglobulin domain
MPFSFGDESINAGDLISVQCAVTKGDTLISMSWLFNGTEISSTEDILISKNSKKVSALTIESVRASHMGEYTCIAKNAAGTSNFSTNLHINGHCLTLLTCLKCLFKFSFPIPFQPQLNIFGEIVSVLPQIVPFSFGDETTNAGDIASVTCTVVKGDTPIAIIWLFNGTEIVSNDEITISKVGKKISMLSIESARADHVGDYACVAKNAAGATNISSYLYINGLNSTNLHFSSICFCV